MSRRRWAVLLGLGGALAAPVAATAYYGEGATIVSASLERGEQGDDASQFAAVASGGRHVVFQTRARNFFADDDPDPPGQYRVGGLFRRDLQTGALTLVAYGDFRDEGSNDLLARGAQNPSVSADGRYVAFSTAQKLLPADTNGNIDVYVRDMAVPTRDAGAFELVSAKSGGSVPATYAPRDPSFSGRDPGSEVSRGAAISADGAKVVFRTIEQASDLPAEPGTTTPGNQVFVRDRTARTTTLVTRTTGSGQPASGAQGPAGISGDGSTVVWTGRNAPAQTRFIGGENTDPDAFFYLWRRVADGPTAPTRRITGVSDPDDPACPPGAQVAFDQSSTGPCYGPLTEPDALRANINSLLPAMDFSGRKVAFLTGSGPRPDASTGPGLDLFTTDMSPGLTRKASTRELTREGVIGDAEASSPIESLTMSSDGRRLALTTTRTTFVSSALRFTGQRRPAATVRDLYVVDLPSRTIERATRAYTGGDTDGDVFNDPTLSSDGGRIGFVSIAGNLFFGDANERSDAFSVLRQPEPAPEPRQPPPAPAPGANREEDLGTGETPELDVGVRRRRDGNVELSVAAPAVGALKAVARGRVGVRRGRRGKVRAISTKLVRARKAGRVRIVLKPVRRYRRELGRRKRLAARVTVTFVASKGGRRVTGSRRVTFRAVKKKRRSTG